VPSADIERAIRRKKKHFVADAVKHSYSEEEKKHSHGEDEGCAQDPGGGSTGNSESIKAGIVQARINLEVAQMIHDARTKAGLSQSKLAALIGSKQPVICATRRRGTMKATR